MIIISLTIVRCDQILKEMEFGGMKLEKNQMEFL